MDISDIYYKHTVKSIHGRYLPPDKLSHLFNKGDVYFKGKSVLNQNINCYKIGKGAIKILLWSQMHGNESTTTKALIDIIAFLSSDNLLNKDILEKLSLYYIPQLNPDGSKLFTRVNSNEIDLNRDATVLSQRESIFLNGVFSNLNPDYCFNLHDQRTLFSAGYNELPAIVSFLSPSADSTKIITPAREKAIKIIVAINDCLQKYIKGCVGRYDDAFNIDCVGDKFTSLGTPTILFEAGHHPNDYHREETRKYIFYSILTALNSIVYDNFKHLSLSDYISIPENQKRFYDIIIKTNTDIAIQYEEVLTGQDITFVPNIMKTGDLSGYYGHTYLQM